MLETSILSFSQNVFYPFKGRNHQLSNIKFAFNLVKPKILLCGNIPLALYCTTIVEAGGIFSLSPKGFNPEEYVFRNPCGYRRKCGHPPFSHCPTIFSTFPSKYFSFWDKFTLPSANAFILDLSQIGDRAFQPFQTVFKHNFSQVSGVRDFLV